MGRCVVIAGQLFGWLDKVGHEQIIGSHGFYKNVLFIKGWGANIVDIGDD